MDGYLYPFIYIIYKETNKLNRQQNYINLSIFLANINLLNTLIVIWIKKQLPIIKLYRMVESDNPNESITSYKCIGWLAPWVSCVLLSIFACIFYILNPVMEIFSCDILLSVVVSLDSLSKKKTQLLLYNLLITQLIIDV